jgi:hypothetical protein
MTAALSGYLAAVDPESADMATEDIATPDIDGHRTRLGDGRLKSGPLRGSRRRLFTGSTG